MSIGINTIKELKHILKRKHSNNYLLDIQNVFDYASDVYEEIKNASKNEEYAINWSNEATISILAITSHFFDDGWSNTTYQDFTQKLKKLYKSKEFIDWCLKDNDADVIAIHKNDEKYSIDISDCFYIQVLNDYAYFLQKVAKAKQQPMLSRLDKGYALKSLKSALKLIKHTIDLSEYLQ